MDPIAFALAVLAILAMPGPTNTLLAASGASVGFGGSWRLVPAEIAGYLVSIAALIFLLGPAIARQPGAFLGLKLAACVWLAVCARNLWREAGAGFSMVNSPISMGRIFVTTLVNPKTLIFAFTIFPQGPLFTQDPVSQLAPWFTGFCGLSCMMAFGWVGMGVLVARSAGPLAMPRRVWRMAAVGLALFAMIFAGSAIAAMY